MAGPHRSVAQRPSFPELEQHVLERWRERDVFAESVRRRQGSPRWGFYEGPPTASGSPGFHHVLSRVFKDIFPRYRTMTGHYVERKGGWDCHGLPVELALEAELGFESKADIEAFGIAEFNARCREKVLSHVDEWNRLTERIGFWVDLDDAYRTLDTAYVESCWWALKTIHEKGLLYEKLKVVPYCPRDQVTLSSHELGQPGAYKDVIDPSVYVRLKITDPRGPLQAGDELVVLDDDPVDAGVERRGRDQPDPDLRAGRARPTATSRWSRTISSTRCWGTTRRSKRVLRRRHRRHAVCAAVPLHPGRRLRPQGPHRAAGRLRRPPTTAPASSTPRSRSATTTSGSARSRG